ncbi:MAG: HypC/HybG/HupF family hydrogenase formation chaperone [Rubrivivax sp.]|nr:HypC/HybG/HupF family hydrogenase formation chaperone [Rubrivivax sp.]
MCLALPARVVALLPGDQAQIDLGGVRKSVSIALVPDVQEGEYVIVHVGHAIGKVDADEAARTLALFAEMESGAQPEGPDGPDAQPPEGTLSAGSARPWSDS